MATVETVRNMVLHKRNFLKLYGLGENVRDEDVMKLGNIIDIAAAVVEQFDKTTGQLRCVVNECLLFENGEFIIVL